MTDKMYMDEQLGLGHVADTSLYQAFSEPAESEIKYGSPVAYNADATAVKTATGKDKVIGIARAVEGKKHSFETADAEGKFVAKEAVTVMHAGSVVVSVSADVTKGQSAVVSGDGFAPAGADATGIIGTFRSNGKAGKTAVLHINL